MGSTSLHEDFEKEIQQLFNLYLEVKAIIALAESMDPGQKTYAGPMNEMRNVLDHVMRCVQYPAKTEHEFHEAHEHLYRAGYDAYEMLAMNIGKRIEDDLVQFSTDVITAILPDYYKAYRPRLSDIKTSLADIRVHKRLDPDIHVKSFREYLPVISELRKIAAHVSTMIPALQEETNRRALEVQQQREREQQQAERDRAKQEAEETRARKARTISIIVPICTAVLGGFVGAYAKGLFEPVKAADPTPPITVQGTPKDSTMSGDTASSSIHGAVTHP